MKHLIEVHFDLLYLFVIFCVLIGVFWFKPEATKEWVAGVIGAILMRIRPQGNDFPPGTDTPLAKPAVPIVDAPVAPPAK
jgi:phosphotransferase system  glucose/maltose/N-acetylglucosamine-specific IIC component